MESTKLCPKCGAYWKCDCVIERPPVRPQPALLKPPAQRSSAPSEPAGLVVAADAGCAHDWTEVVGVELEEDALSGKAQVLVCRLCGLYAVEHSA